MYYLGIDVAKQHHDALGIDATGQVVLPAFRFANTQQGVGELITRLQALDGPVQIGLEATGHYWLPLHEALTAQGYAVAVYNPLQIAAFRHTGLRKTKTDTVDCRWIADFTRLGPARPMVLPAPAARQLREVARWRLKLLQREADIQRQALTILDRVFPEYTSLFPHPFNPSSRAVLRRAVTPQAITAWPLDDLVTTLRRASRGHFGLEHAQRLHTLAHTSLGIRSLDPVAHSLLLLALAHLDLLDGQIDSLDHELARLLEQTGTHLTSIPGLSTTLAAIILGEIADIRRFDCLAQLVAFAGLDPTVHQSGQFQASHAHLSKRGSVYLRRALWLAASVARQHDPDLKALYLRKRDQHKHHSVAMGAVCHRLLARIYVILKEQRPYQLRPSEPSPA